MNESARARVCSTGAITAMQQFALRMVAELRVFNCWARMTDERMKGERGERVDDNRARWDENARWFQPSATLTLPRRVTQHATP